MPTPALLACARTSVNPPTLLTSGARETVQSWLALVASDMTSPQLGVAVEGGSGTRVPDVSVEADDGGAVYEQARRAEFDIPYGIITEP